jgi:hypothetical protein
MVLLCQLVAVHKPDEFLMQGINIFLPLNVTDVYVYNSEADCQLNVLC